MLECARHQSLWRHGGCKVGAPFGKEASWPSSGAIRASLNASVETQSGPNSGRCQNIQPSAEKIGHSYSMVLAGKSDESTGLEP